MSKTVNPDIDIERTNSKLDVEKLKEFLGKNLLASVKRYPEIKNLSIHNFLLSDFYC
jgi:hypothetical protein